MEKYHKIAAIVFAFIFLILLQQFSVIRPMFRIMAGSVIIFLVVLNAYNYRYLKSASKYNFWTLLAPAFFYSSAFLVFFILPNEVLKGLFLLISVALGAFFEAFLSNYSENIYLAQHLITAFGFFVSFAAFNYSFPKFYFAYLLAMFFSVFLLARSLYEFTPKRALTKLVAALVIALFSSELFWAVNFLPFHFSVMGFFLFSMFYLCVILNYYFFYQSLTAKKLIFHFILVFASNIAVFLATPWSIIS